MFPICVLNLHGLDWLTELQVCDTSSCILWFWLMQLSILSSVVLDSPWENCWLIQNCTLLYLNEGQLRYASCALLNIAIKGKRKEFSFPSCLTAHSALIQKRWLLYLSGKRHCAKLLPVSKCVPALRTAVVTLSASNQFFLIMVQQPQCTKASSLSKILDHTQTHHTR